MDDGHPMTTMWAKKGSTIHTPYTLDATLFLQRRIDASTHVAEKMDFRKLTLFKK